MLTAASKQGGVQTDRQKQTFFACQEDVVKQLEKPAKSPGKGPVVHFIITDYQT